MNKEYFEGVASFTVYIIITVFFILSVRLYVIQILNGSDYRDAADSNRVRAVSLPASRGIIYDRSGTPLVKNKPYFYASLIPGRSPVDTHGLAALTKTDESKLAAKIKKEKNNIFKTIVLKEGLSFKEVAEIEARKSDFPGLIVETSVTRNYVYNTVGSHVIGYLGKPNKQQIEKLQLDDVSPETFIGQWGVEQLYDSTLRGTAGRKIIEVDALGRQLKELEVIKPITGGDITLSLDINLQQIAEQSFKDKTGSLVALDPKTGEVLAMASMPSFDPNDFVMGIDSEKWSALHKDKQYPLLNRALQSSYPPGSVFKVLMSVAGLDDGAITTTTPVGCTGEMHYGKWSFGCWKAHGTVTFHRGLVQSCDIYFYDVGRRLGIDKIHKYARMFGLGKKTGLDIVGGEEREGLIPSIAWKQKKMKQPWFLGETFVASIGQGYVNITPAQAALLSAMVANEGLPIHLSLLKGTAPPDESKRLKIKPEVFAEVKSAMYGVVNEGGGTGGSSRSALVHISGKTGTAQVVKGRVKTETLKQQLRDHGWFIAYAPSEDPQIAVAAVVEHGGHGGSAAAPIVKNVIEAFVKSPYYKKPVQSEE
ncbi:MAG: penicillin-binding protein 2 [Nitrospirae bacterium]|nr:penicillin-binding protein 2 [Nitrospirota bacterium]MBF0536098.1 penicillin-binding protein 2 [Nitrospirota bacterium]MBF0616834.1 penicillin-binding protein 2 [Nitrospirota bacterium]